MAEQTKKDTRSDSEEETKFVLKCPSINDPALLCKLLQQRWCNFVFGRVPAEGLCLPQPTGEKIESYQVLASNGRLYAHVSKDVLHRARNGQENSTPMYYGEPGDVAFYWRTIQAPHRPSFHGLCDIGRIDSDDEQEWQAIRQLRPGWMRGLRRVYFHGFNGRHICIYPGHEEKEHPGWFSWFESFGQMPVPQPNQLMCGIIIQSKDLKHERDGWEFAVWAPVSIRFYALWKLVMFGPNPRLYVISQTPANKGDARPPREMLKKNAAVLAEICPLSVRRAWKRHLSNSRPTEEDISVIKLVHEDWHDGDFAHSRALANAMNYLVVAKLFLRWKEFKPFSRRDMIQPSRNELQQALYYLGRIRKTDSPQSWLYDSDDDYYVPVQQRHDDTRDHPYAKVTIEKDVTYTAMDHLSAVDRDFDSQHYAVSLLLSLKKLATCFFADWIPMYTDFEIGRRSETMSKKWPLRDDWAEWIRTHYYREFNFETTDASKK